MDKMANAMMTIFNGQRINGKWPKSVELSGKNLARTESGCWLSFFRITKRLN